MKIPRLIRRGTINNKAKALGKTDQLRYSKPRKVVENWFKKENLVQSTYIWIQPFIKPLKNQCPKLTWRAIVGVDFGGGGRFYLLRGYRNEVLSIEKIIPAWGFYPTGAPILSDPRNRSLERRNHDRTRTS